jgi:pyruvate,water dikinase
MIEINAAWGLGEAIVGGQLTPDTITVERASGRIMRTVINKKMIMTGLIDGGVTSLPVAEDRQNAPALSEPQVQRLRRSGARSRGHFPRPDGHRVVSPR